MEEAGVRGIVGVSHLLLMLGYKSNYKILDAISKAFLVFYLEKLV